MTTSSGRSSAGGRHDAGSRAVPEVTAGEQATPCRPLRADAARNQARLIEAARAVFLEQGAQAPLEEVAKRAGVGIGTLYRRFPSRLELLEAIYHDDVRALAESATELLAEHDPWDALTEWVGRFSDYAVSKRVLFTELLQAVDRDSSVMTHSREVVNEAATRVLTAAQRSGSARDDVTSADLVRLVGGCSMMGVTDREQARRMVQVILDGLRV